MYYARIEIFIINYIYLCMYINQLNKLLSRFNILLSKKMVHKWWMLMARGTWTAYWGAASLVLALYSIVWPGRAGHLFHGSRWSLIFFFWEFAMKVNAWNFQRIFAMVIWINIKYYKHLLAEENILHERLYNCFVCLIESQKANFFIDMWMYMTFVIFNTAW
jgi:hypothetical protein